MSRMITLFTGQWVDLPFREVCRLAADWGYDGLEVAAAGDHLDVWRAAEDDAYVKAFKDTLEEFGLSLYALSLIHICVGPHLCSGGLVSLFFFPGVGV